MAFERTENTPPALWRRAYTLLALPPRWSLGSSPHFYRPQLRRQCHPTCKYTRRTTGPHCTSNVVKGLLYANHADEYKYLLQETAGLLFLGTPFRGTKFGPFAEAIAKLTKVSRSHDGIVKELSFDNQVLLDKLHEFCSLRNKLFIPVACFFELYETDYGRRYISRGIVQGMVSTRKETRLPKLTSVGRRRGVGMYSGPPKTGTSNGPFEVEQILRTNRPLILGCLGRNGENALRCQSCHTTTKIPCEFPATQRYHFR